MTLNVVTVRVGSKYDMDYSAKSHDMIARNLSTRDDVRHFEITDDPHACPEYVTPIPHGRAFPGWWGKIQLFAPHMPWNEGERVFFCDLDNIITGRLEELIETKGIMRDKFWPMFSSAVMVWDHGEHRQIWDNFKPEMITAPGPFPDIYPEGQVNGGDQEIITRLDPDWPILPAEWTRSYVDAALWPPDGCKIVVFHGAQKPHNQPKGSWIWNVWKIGGYTELAPMSGMNVAKDQALANVAANIKLDLEWFTGMPPHRGTLVLVCGGPSMKDHIREIKDHKQRGAKIATVNNALKYLLSVGIRPDHHIILDARPENVEFLQDAPEGIRYFLASQCDPSLFEALRHRDVILWHNGIGDGEEIVQLCEGIDQPCVIVPGGCTVGLRSWWLAYGSGYRKMHVYGMDSSYAAGEHHAYPQALNDADSTIEVALGDKRYICSRWMARQANDFKVLWPQITAGGMQAWVHGTGLIPDLYRTMRASQQEAA